MNRWRFSKEKLKVVPKRKKFNQEELEVMPKGKSLAKRYRFS
jgi:hypothetical protein